jgi:hypothetical protein
MSDREEMEALNEWMREPDAENFSLADITDWINRRPIVTVARLAARTGPDVAVKPLEWGPYPNPVFAGPDVAVASFDVFGGHHYQVQRDPNAEGYIAYLAPDFGTLFWESKGHSDIEAAKAAAQADYEQRIRSAITALPAPGGVIAGWQPIETAPLDYKVVLLYQPGGSSFAEAVGQGHRTDLRQHAHDKWVFQGTGLICEPTHWMPLPPAPTITRKSKSEERS